MFHQIFGVGPIVGPLVIASTPAAALRKREPTEQWLLVAPTLPLKV